MYSNRSRVIKKRFEMVKHVRPMDNGHGSVVLEELILKNYQTALAGNHCVYIPSAVRRKLKLSRFQRFLVSVHLDNGEFVIVLKKLSKEVT